MNKDRSRQGVSLPDRVALEIQELHKRGKLGDTQPLLRIDQQQEAARAPFQFDAVRGRLHRNGCPAIPASSKSAVYGVWEFRPNEQHLACPRCKPVPQRKRKMSRTRDTTTTDLVYGVLSILDQFGGVLRERGREYRRSQNGHQRRSAVQDLYETFGTGERSLLDVIGGALDGLRSVIDDLQRGIAANGNGTDSNNGHHDTSGRNGTDGGGSRRRVRRSR